MAYIGVQPTAGQYRKLDNISASFNGSTTSFTTSVGGTNVTAGTAQQLIVSLGGVIQQPDTDYTVSTNTITFTTAPTSGLDFFAILMGDALNTVTPSDGSVTTSKLAGSLSVGLADGTVSAPSLFFTGDTNCGLFSPSDDQLAVTTNGVERVEWGTSEVVFNDGGNDYDFRVEGDTNANLLFVDASTDRVGVGTASPVEKLDVATASGDCYIRTTNGTVTLYSGISSSYTAGFVGTSTSHPLVLGAANAEKARIDTSGRLLVGTSTARANMYNSVATATLQLEAVSATTGAGRISVVYNDNSADSSSIIIGKSRATTVGGSTVVQSGDALGNLSWQGADGSELVEAASIRAEVDATPGANDMPGRLVFSTTADGASSPTERLRIANNGQLSAVVPGNSTLYPGFMARAWINFDGTSGSIGSGRASGNVSSVTDNGTGDYTINFSTSMPDTNYCVVTGMSGNSASSNGNEFYVSTQISGPSYNSGYTATGSIRMLCMDGTGTNRDAASLNLAVFR